MLALYHISKNTLLNTLLNMSAYVNVGQFSTHQFEIFEILHIYVSVKSKVQHPPPPGTPSGHPFRAFEFFLEICVQIPDSLGQKAVHMPHLIYFHANYV